MRLARNPASASFVRLGFYGSGFKGLTVFVFRDIEVRVCGVKGL